MFIDFELCTFFLVGGIFYHYVIFLVLQSTLSIIMCVSVCMLVIILLDVFWDLGIVVTILINFGKFSITLLSLQIFLLHYLCCLLQFWYFPKFLDALFFFPDVLLFVSVWIISIEMYLQGNYFLSFVKPTESIDVILHLC